MAGAAHSDADQKSALSAPGHTGLSWRSPGARVAQAGSAGGTIGLKDKSISGDTQVQPPPPPPAKASRPQAARTNVMPGPATTANRCRSIVGTWTSWASGMFGPNDTRFNADGTITHPSSKGTWSCDNGLYTHDWEAFGRRGPYRLSADGKQLIKIQDGSVSFFRGGAAATTR